MSALLNLLMTWLQSPDALKLIAQNLEKILAFFSSLNTTLAEAKAKGIGRDEAVAQMLAQVEIVLKKAKDAAAEAEREHMAHPDDDKGFDPDVFRKEP